MGVRTQKTQRTGGCLPIQRHNLRVALLLFAGDAVFVAVAAAVGSIERISIKRFAPRCPALVFGTDLRHSAFKAYIDYTALRDNRVGVLRDDI